MINKKHIGSSFDNFLEEENILQESEKKKTVNILINLNVN